jgi:hypothetical protein
MPSRRGVLLVVLVVAGCGSTSVAHEAREQPKAESTFQAEAKAACADFPRRLNRIRRTTAAESDLIWLRLADEWGVTLQKLRRLDPPPAKERRFRTMLAYFDRAVRAARAVPKAEGEEVLAPIVGVLDQGGKGATIARSLGLLRCSAVPPEPTAAERARGERYLERQVRRQFERMKDLPRLDQPTHPAGVGPGIKAPPGP